MPAFILHDVDRMIGIRLRQLRLAAGLSREDIAKHLSATVRQIERFESGEDRLGTGRLTKLSERFGVSVLTFFETTVPLHQAEAISSTRLGTIAAAANRQEQVRAFVDSVLKTAASRARS